MKTKTLKTANEATTRSHYRLTRKAALVIAALLGDTAAALAEEPKPAKANSEKSGPVMTAKYMAEPPPRDSQPVPAHMVVRPPQPAPAPDAKNAPDAGVKPSK